jgi:invasion protein IalB
MMMWLSGLPRLPLGIALAFLAVGPAAAQQATPPAATPGAKPAAAEHAAQGQREARTIKFDDWQKVCFKPGGAKMICRTTINGTFDTGQDALHIYLTEREGDSTARLQIFVPVGLYVPGGVKLTVDKGSAYKIPIKFCLSNTCIAGDLAAPALLGAMEAGKSLALEVIDTNMLAVTTSLPLAKFAAARKGAPAQVFEQKIDE